MPSTKWSWLTEPIVYYSISHIVALGAGATLAPAFKKICTFSGKISYPLYMTHYAVMFMFLNYFTTHKPGNVEIVLIITIGTILLVSIAYLVTVIYDIPVRRYLTSKRK